MNFGDPSAIGTEMADRFVVSGANLTPPLFKIGLTINNTFQDEVLHEILPQGA